MAERHVHNQAGPPNATKTIVIGTAGHIDHGKTALIRALTGVDTDRLPEEKKRGITIDLGFASLDLARPGETPLRVSFIDVPGHARFVRNMLAGAGGIDAVLLVISAEEGVKPQTEEHLAICSLLGIQRGITVLAKIDAVDEVRLRDIRSSVKNFLSATFLASEPIVKTSAFTGAGLDELRSELGLLVTRISQRNLDYLPRLPIDRAFTMKGFGTVVTGTLMTGAVSAGEEFTIEPGAKPVKVRGIQVHGGSVTKAEAATRAALNLSRIEAAELQRGDTLVKPSSITAVDTIDAEINLLPEMPPLKHCARVHFHAFASECMATVSLYGYQAIEPNTVRLARLRLSHPIVLLPGDRFVLRQGSPITTVGGGTVLDAHPLQRLKKAETKAWLALLQQATPERQLALRVKRRGQSGIPIAELSSEMGLLPEAISTCLRPELQSGNMSLFENDLVVASDTLRAAGRLVEQELERLFKVSGAPELKRSALKSRLGLRAEVVDWILRELEMQGRLRSAGEEILSQNADRRSAMLDQQNTDAIELAYQRAGLASPSPANLATELAIEPEQMRRRITILLREKKLVRLGDDSLCVHQSALADLKQRVQSLRGQALNVARFKELAGVSRKYAIPLLEYLDRERITRKQGDERIVL